MQHQINQPISFKALTPIRLENCKSFEFTEIFIKPLMKIYNMLMIIVGMKMLMIIVDMNMLTMLD